MSDSHPEIGVDESRLVRGGHGVLAEPDDMRVGKVVIVGAISLFIFLLGGFLAYWILLHFEREYSPEGLHLEAAALPAYEIGIVNQRSFNLDYHAEDKLDAQAKTLNSYGVSDPVTGKVHIPVDVAMNQVLAASKNRPPEVFPAPDAGTASDAGISTDAGTPADGGTR